MATYFFDSYLPSRLAHMLRVLDVSIVHQSELTPHQPGGRITADTDWVTVVRENGYIFVTVDRVSRKDTPIPLVLELNDVPIVFLPPNFLKLDKWTQASWLIKNWPTIDAYNREVQLKKWARVSLGGDIEPIGGV